MAGLGIVAWLAGSRLGRYLALLGLGLAVLGLGGLYLARAGRNSERARADLARAMAQAAALAKRVAVDNDLARLPSDARRERLRVYAERAAARHLRSNGRNYANP